MLRSVSSTANRKPMPKQAATKTAQSTQGTQGTQGVQSAQGPSTSIKQVNTTRKLPLSVLMRTARERKGKTLDQMAEMAGLAKSTLWEMEADLQLDPRLSSLKRVCWSYGFGISRIDNHDIVDSVYDEE